MSLNIKVAKIEENIVTLILEVVDEKGTPLFYFDERSLNEEESLTIGPMYFDLKLVP